MAPTLFFNKNTLFIICAVAGRCLHHGVCMEVKDSLKKLVLLVCQLGLRDLTQPIRWDCQTLLPLVQNCFCFLPFFF